MKRRGFTLIEMMIVVALLVTLMMIVFKLTGVGSDHWARSTTIKRMQALENALSGYYAAFGSYPPVKLHGSRNIYLETDDYGIQSYTGETVKGLNWGSVKAACLSQPVAARYPFHPRWRDYIHRIAEELKFRCQSAAYPEHRANAGKLKHGFDALERPTGQVDPNETDWRKCQIFQFGLLSYLLPRYLFMTCAIDSTLYDYAQWGENNEKQVQCYSDGHSDFTWSQIWNDASIWPNQDPYGRIRTLPSQAVCARWMPCLEHVIHNGQTFFGIDTCAPGLELAVNEGAEPPLFCPSGNRSNQYVLDCMTVYDGWQQELYYYSPPPYQSYRLWSAGPNKMTFPPWIELSALDSHDRETAAWWISDDLEGLKH